MSARQANPGALLLIGWGMRLALALMGNYLQSQSLGSQPRRMHAALAHLRDATARLQLAEPLRIADLPPGQTPGTERSLQSAIALSDHALSEKLRAALRDLAVLPAKPASFAESAAQAVCALPTDEIGPVLDALTDAALLECAGLDRYQIHQAIADYARLDGPHRSAQERCVRHFLAYVSTPTLARDMLDREWENIQAALDFARQRQMAQEMIALVEILAPIMLNRGMYAATDAALQQALTVVQAPGDHMQILHYIGRLELKRGESEAALKSLTAALALSDGAEELRSRRNPILATLGMLHNKRGDYAQVEQVAQEGLALAHEFGDDASLGILLQLSGVLHQKRGNYTAAKAAFQDAVAIAMRTENSELLAGLLSNLGGLMRKEGDNIQAERYYQEALALARRLGYRERISVISRQLGVIAFERGATQEAQKLCDTSLHEARAIVFEEGIQAALLSLGAIAAQQEDFPQAQTYMTEGLAIARTLGQRDTICIFLTNLGMMAVDMGDHAQAEQYLSEGIIMARALQNRERICDLLDSLGVVALARGALVEAEVHAAEGLDLAQKINHREKIALALLLLGRISVQRRDLGRAEHLLQDSLARLQAMNNTRMASAAACELGEVYMAEGQWSHARPLLEMALADSMAAQSAHMAERARQSLVRCESHVHIPQP